MNSLQPLQFSQSSPDKDSDHPRHDLSTVKKKRKKPLPDIGATSKKQETGLSMFWNGIIIYMVAYAMSATTEVYVSAAICQGFQLIGFGMFVLGAVQVAKFKFDSPYLQTMVSLYLVYVITIIFRGAKYDSNSIKQMLFSVGSGVLPYFTPIVLLLPRNIAMYRKMFRATIVLGIFYILFVFLFYNIIHDPDILNLTALILVEVFFGILAFGCAYVLLNFKYHMGKKGLFAIGKYNIISILVMAIALFFAIYRARRGVIFFCVTSLMAACLWYFIHAKNKAMVIFMSVIMTATITIYFAGRKTPAMFNFLLDRGQEDTRSGVEEYLYADMTSTDWVIGKGFKGKYFCPIIDNVNDPSGYREEIETGYLQIILKGGMIHIALLLVILVPAIYMGIFKSKNVLSKASATWILLWMVYQYPTVGFGFMVQYIMVWISVGICYSPTLRNSRDEVIEYYLKAKTLPRLKK